MTASVSRRALLSVAPSRLYDRVFRSATSLVATLLCAVVAGCSGDGVSPNNELKISSIVIDGGARVLERGTVVQLTTTVRDTANKVVSIPIAWRSDAERIASIDLNGVLTAGDTGVTILRASALGVQAQPV